MRLAVFSNSFSLGSPMLLMNPAVSGLNSCPGWLVTTAMAVLESWKTAAPLFSPRGTQSGGTEIWQVDLASFTVFQPDGVCAHAVRLHKRTKVQTMHSLMPGA